MTMESTDTTTHINATPGFKPRHQGSKSRGAATQPRRTQAVVPGWSPVDPAPELQAQRTAVLLESTPLERCVAETTFESCEGVVVMDANLCVLNVNNSFTRITGYSKREAIGHACAILEPIRDHLVRERVWNDEMCSRKKNGDTFFAKLRVKALVDTNDAVTHYIATFNDLSAKKALQRKIANLNFTDTLTGLKSRSALLISLQRAIEKSRAQQSHGAVILVDIDDFKSHNVRLGHLAGDSLLQQTSRRMCQALGPDTALARLYADKFLVILDELGATAQEAHARTRQVAAQVRQCFATAFCLDASSVHLSVSMGCCLIGMQEQSTDVLINRVELVTYTAKEVGGGCTVSFECGEIHEDAAEPRP